MSTNVSLNNAGTSLNFDGQALQNQQEAEMEREDQLQQNELRQLLSNAFDDLDDDVLSVVSSEDDSVNTSHLSSHHDVSSLRGSLTTMERTTNTVVNVGGNNTNTNTITSTHTVAMATNAALNSYNHHPTPPPTPPPHHLLPHHSLRASQEGSLGGGMSHNSPQPERFPWSQTYEADTWSGERGIHADPDRDHAWGVRKGGGETVVGERGGGGEEEEEEPQHDVVDGLQSSLSSVPYVTTVPAYPYTAVTHAAVVSGASSLPYSHNSSDQFSSGGAGQYWGAGTYLPPGSHPAQFPQFGSAAVGGGGGGGGGGGLSAQLNQDSANNTAGFSASQGWSTPHVKTTTTVTAGPDRLPFSQPNAMQSADRGGAYPHYVPDSYSDTGHPGWNRAVSCTQGMDCAATTTAAAAASTYPVYPTPGSLLTRGWDGGEGGGGGGGQQGAELSGTKGGNYDDDYTVAYKKRRSPAPPPMMNHHPAAGSGGGSDLKVNFIMQEGDSEDRSRQSQLQMLYQARGRQLEDLRSQLDAVTQESSKERRMLKHLLSVATGEKEGMEKSLQQSQQLLVNVREEQSQTTTQLHTSHTQLKALSDSKEELVQKLQSAETTIETLSHQVAGLQGTDSLTQARHQHEAVVTSMQQRFDSQILDLKQQLDIANSHLQIKGEETGRLQGQVREQTRRAEEAQVSRGETINQLTRSLEESQQRCQALLNASSNEEGSKLRAQLQQSLMSKKMADDMCSSLQGEVQELKEQLHLLESATSLGALTTTPHSDALFNDTISDLGIRKTLDFSTPESNSRFDSGQSSEELVVKLRRELERCVVSNRQKRQQVGELQVTTKRLTGDVHLLTQQLTGAQHTLQTQQVKLTSYEERLGGSLQPSAVESRLKRDMDNLQLDNKALLKDLEDYKARLNELSSNEDQLTQMNDQLKKQMAAMVMQHDLDMRQAIDRSRESSDEGHKLSRQKLEHQLRSELFADKQELIMKYEGQLDSTRSELQNTQEELDTVKELYVQAGCDLTQRDAALRSKDEELQQAIVDEKRKWESEREVAMETVWQQRLQKARSDWESENGTDWRQKLETEKQKWQSENRQHAEETWQQRLGTECAKWESQKEAEMETTLTQRLDSARQEWESQKLSQAEKDWEQRLHQEREKWESQKTASLTSELEQKLEKQRESEKIAVETEWQARLERERRSWQVRSDREALEQSDIAVATARRDWQGEAQEQLKSLTSQLEDCRDQHQRELVSMEAKWRQEVEEKERRREQHLQETLEAEVEEKLRLQKAALMETAQETLQQELSRADQRHQEEVERRVREEGERAASDTRRQLEGRREQDAHTDLQEAKQWKEELQRLQSKLQQQTQRWSEERSKLTAEKDEERRQAVSQVRSECRSDYQRLTEDSRATLDSALDSARQHHQRQLEEMERRYKEELSALRTVEQELRQALCLSSDSEEPNPAPTHTSDRWATLQKEAERWRKEGEKLRKEVEKREELLQQADQHMERQVQKLKGSLSEGYLKQREKDALRLQNQYSQALQINQKERTRLERQVEILQLRLREFSPRPDTEREEEEEDGEEGLRSEERERLTEELGALQEENERVKAELGALREENESLEGAVREEGGRRQRQQQQQEDLLRQLRQQVAELSKERDALTQRQKDAQMALHTLARDKDLQATQLREQAESLQQRLEQTLSRSHQLEQALKAVTQQHKRDLEVLHETHAQKMAALNNRLAQTQQQQRTTLEELREQHKSERAALVEDLEQKHRSEQRSLEESLEQKHRADTASVMEEVRRQARRALADTPTQTDSEEGLYHVKDQYLQAVQNIKEEVMGHISLSNERAAMTMKVEIRRERQRTIQHLRNRCKTRLHQLLGGQLDRYSGSFLNQTRFRLQTPDMWSLMDQALDSLFDSVSSSRSATPGTSNPITPRSSSEDDATLASHHANLDTSVGGGRGGGGEVRGGNVNNSSLNNNNFLSNNNSLHINSTHASTPQSSGSERYALPAALSMPEISHQRTHGSLEDLQASGVFYSLLPDDTASVTDSELEFKVPQAVKKTGARRNTGRVGKTSSVSDLRQGRSTPPKMTSRLSVFAGGSNASPPPHSPTLLSPKLHREGKGRVGLWRAGEEGVVREGEGGWKGMDGDGWMAAVGSTNLWQAYSNLQSLETEEKEPRRQLRFSSQSLADSATDSDASFTSIGDRLPQHDDSDSSAGHHRNVKVKVKVSPSPGDKPRRSAFSRSEDFSLVEESLSLRPSGRHDGQARHCSAQAGERTLCGKTQPQFSDQSPQLARGQGSGRSSLTSSHPDLGVKGWEETPPGRKKTRTLNSRHAPHNAPLSVPAHSSPSQHAPAHHAQHAQLSSAASSKLLNPKDFLTRPGKKRSPSERPDPKSSPATSGESSTQGETTHPLAEREGGGWGEKKQGRGEKSRRERKSPKEAEQGWRLCTPCWRDWELVPDPRNPPTTTTTTPSHNPPTPTPTSHTQHPRRATLPREERGRPTPPQHHRHRRQQYPA